MSVRHVDLREKAPARRKQQHENHRNRNPLQQEGRRYVPAYSLAHWNYDGDMMPVGQFRLVHAQRRRAPVCLTSPRTPPHGWLLPRWHCTP